MRYLVVSDLHGNLPALEAVIEHARDYEQILFLGDAVGYYPDADKVVSWLRHNNAIGVMGNHDIWLIQLGSMATDGPVMEILARQSSRISPENRLYLSQLQWTREIDGALLVHGSPGDPLAYLDELELAKKAFDETPQRWIFHGHTHLCGAYMSINNQGTPWVRYQRYSHGGELIVAPKARAIINPGSVGQPRDGVLGAAYVIWDSQEDTVEFHRVKYDQGQVLDRINVEGYPMWLYERLQLGK